MQIYQRNINSSFSINDKSTILVILSFVEAETFSIYVFSKCFSIEIDTNKPLNMKNVSTDKKGNDRIYKLWYSENH